MFYNLYYLHLIYIYIILFIYRDLERLRKLSSTFLDKSQFSRRCVTSMVSLLQRFIAKVIGLWRSSYIHSTGPRDCHEVIALLFTRIILLLLYLWLSIDVMEQWRTCTRWTRGRATVIHVCRAIASMWACRKIQCHIIGACHGIYYYSTDGLGCDILERETEEWFVLVVLFISL